MNNVLINKATDYIAPALSSEELETLRDIAEGAIHASDKGTALRAAEGLLYQAQHRGNVVADTLPYPHRMVESWGVDFVGPLIDRVESLNRYVMSR